MVLAATAGVVTLGPPSVRPWDCHSRDQQPSARAALDRYYASCWSRPDKIEGPYDGGTGSTGYETWHRLDEFTVVYAKGKTRFLLVGQGSAGSGWRVLDGEATGP